MIVRGKFKEVHRFECRYAGSDMFPCTGWHESTKLLTHTRACSQKCGQEHIHDFACSHFWLREHVHVLTARWEHIYSLGSFYVRGNLFTIYYWVLLRKDNLFSIISSGLWLRVEVRLTSCIAIIFFSISQSRHRQQIDTEYFDIYSCIPWVKWYIHSISLIHTQTKKHSLQ